MRSRSFNATDKFEIGLYELTSVVSRPAFLTISVINVTLYSDGKWPAASERLNSSVKYSATKWTTFDKKLIIALFLSASWNVAFQWSYWICCTMDWEIAIHMLKGMESYLNFANLNFVSNKDLSLSSPVSASVTHSMPATLSCIYHSRTRLLSHCCPTALSQFTAG